MAEVQRHAPNILLDREAELASLAAFCSADPAYVWWKAHEWAGKSALMAAFVVDPPLNAEVVSFFVNSRLAAYSTSEGYVSVMLDQLVPLAGEGSPSPADRADRELRYHQMLNSAAGKVAALGRRLVLVVDGLDEDRSASAGLRSIASLLPAVVDHISVIVTSRPSPPIPADVNPRHPLRQCATRALSMSPHAREIARLAKAELDGLITSGDPIQGNLVGLLSAADDALSRRDLEELTGVAWAKLEAVLHGVAGRTIVKATAADQYSFAHEALRKIAKDRVGVAQTGYRAMINAWAGIYRRRGWPADSPTYLGRPYFSMVLASGDLNLVTELALDPVRHEFLLLSTGGDGSASYEVNHVLTLHSKTHKPDLSAIARLALTRDVLSDRNSGIPSSLPALWAAAGQVDKALAIIGGVESPKRPTALLLLLDTLVDLCQYRLAADIARSLPKAAGPEDLYELFLRLDELAGDKPPELLKIVGENPVSNELDDLSGMVAEKLRLKLLIANLELTEVEGESDPGPRWSAETTTVVQAMAKAGQLALQAGKVSLAQRRCRIALDKLNDLHPTKRHKALVAVVETLMSIGETDEAAALAKGAATLARTVPSETYEAEEKAVAALATTGLFDVATTVARSIDDIEAQGRAMTCIADELVEQELFDDALALPAMVLNLEEAPRTAAHVAAGLVRAGRSNTADALLARYNNDYQRGIFLVSMIARLSRWGLIVEAEQFTSLIRRPAEKAEALVWVGKGAAASGDTEHAVQFAFAAEIAARRAYRRNSAEHNATVLIEQLCARGDVRQGERLALRLRVEDSSSHRTNRDHALSLCSVELWRRGSALEAERVLANISSERARDWVRASRVQHTADTGDYELCDSQIELISTATQSTRAYSELASVATRRGDYVVAEGAARVAKELARAAARDGENIFALIHAGKAAAVTGDLEATMTLADRVQRAEWDTAGITLAPIARILGSAGEIQAVEDLAELAFFPDAQALILAAAAQGAAAADKRLAMSRFVESAVEHAYWLAEFSDTSIASSYHIDYVVREVANALAVVGQLDQASRLAEWLRDKKAYDAAMLTVVCERLRSDDASSFETYTSAFCTDEGRARAWCAMASALAKRGDLEGARTFTARAAPVLSLNELIPLLSEVDYSACKALYSELMRIFQI